MALYHVHVDVLRKGGSRGGSSGLAQYVQREAPEKATQYARYVGREAAGKDDLVERGDGGLPSWAQDGTHFFTMADRYERQNGTVARTVEMALPRELSPEARLDLAADIRASFFEDYPHVYGIHNPIDRQGQEHPHM